LVPFLKAKMAREAGEQDDNNGGADGRQDRGTSPGRGHDRHGNLVGAAKAAKEGHLMGAAAQQHEAKMQREREV
jgi:hypothetical protein